MKILELIKALALLGICAAIAVMSYLYMRSSKWTAIDGCASQSRYTVEYDEGGKHISATEYQKWHFDACLKQKGITL